MVQRMTSKLPAELQRSEVEEAILQSLVRAYVENQDRHDPAVGDDALTFGIHLWKSGTFFLAERLGSLPDVTAEVVNQSLTLQIGRCRLRLHKLGESEFDNPEASFPNNIGPAARMGRVEQLAFKFRGSRGRDEYLDWVIGHYGNPEDGLRAVRLQAVGSERALDGKIARWEAVETLFDASTGASLPVVTRPVHDDVVVAPEPAIALRVVVPERKGAVDPA